MTHAFLCCDGQAVKPHGKEFQQKVREINEALSINIRTTHRYMTWWRCDGKCRDLETSLFGYVSKVNCDQSDFSQVHKNHKINCGGTFHEAEEPSKDRLKDIMKRYKLIKSKLPVKKKIARKSTKSRFNFSQRSAKTIDYVTSDDEA